MPGLLLYSLYNGTFAIFLFVAILYYLKICQYYNRDRLPLSTPWESISDID
ncbi:hypothetical protein NIES39_O05160 [Arthrospira platensis NIES-39]|nr:hypothetical protein NIES39_O05160 [Arthrospira platensis NIES-39]